MSPVLLLVIYCACILLSSLAGGWIPLLIRLTHARMQVAVSLVAGVMLGVGLLHLLPHAVLEAPDAVETVFAWALGGFLVMFFVERFFCFHHHEVPQVAEQGEPAHGDAPHAHQDENGPHFGSDAHRLTWGGAVVGLSLHTVFAGIALAASVQADTQGVETVAAAGLGTFLVIFLHKPFDAMTISALMAVGGWSTLARHVVNGLFALVVPLGVVLFYLGLGQAHSESNLLAYALAFSAGTFLCISMSDLLPELQFHTHDRGKLSAALLAGLAIAWTIGLLEEKSRPQHHPARPAGVETLDRGDPGPEHGHLHGLGR